MPPWLPILLAIVVTALALTATGSPPAIASRRRLWMASTLVLGALTIAATVRLAQRQTEETVALAGTSAGPAARSAQSYGPSVSDLQRRIRALEDHVKELEAGSQARSITQASADGLTAYLQQFGSRRVIVSCIPNDLEAYRYANQLVNLLKSAHWEAQGPQVTKIFGDVRSPGVNLYVNGDDHSDTAKILLDGFAKFNIPYQSRVTPNGAIPDPETVELFIGTKESQRAGAG